MYLALSGISVSRPRSFVLKYELKLIYLTHYSDVKNDGCTDKSVTEYIIQNHPNRRDPLAFYDIIWKSDG